MRRSRDRDFVPHVELVPPAARERLLLVVHGALGSGQNFRLFARKLATECPRWGFALVDVRGHGRSRGAPPPHDFAAVAADFARLEVALPRRPDGVLGHSLGGKLALRYAAARPGELEQVWVLDAQPGPRPAEGSPTLAVVAMLHELRGPHETRTAFVEALRARGLSRTIADWLAMSLDRIDPPAGSAEATRYRLGLELGTIEALIRAYFACDLWPEVERIDARRELHVVAGGRSDVIALADRARLGALGAPGVNLHVLPEAGHWLHVDAPDALRALLVAALC